MLRKKSTKLQGIILIAEQILPTSIQLSNKSNGEFDLSIYDEAFELSSLSVHRAEKSNKNNDLRVFFTIFGTFLIAVGCVFLSD